MLVHFFSEVDFDLTEMRRVVAVAALEVRVGFSDRVRSLDFDKPLTIISLS
jgi:hypothetical protein